MLSEFLPLAMPDKSIIITRPLAQADLFAQKISALGRRAIVFPLFEISPLPDQRALKAILNDLASYALVGFVGPNAIDAAFAHLSHWPDEVAIGIMGEGSRIALAKHGVTDANAQIFMPRDTARSDSETLLEALDLEALRSRKVLIVRGETGRELLANALRSAGGIVTQVAAYRRSVPVLGDAGRQQLTKLLATQNDWIVTSSEALRNLMQMVSSIAGDEGVAELQLQHLLVSHVRIAENAHKLGFINVTCAGSGDERLLAALQF